MEIPPGKINREGQAGIGYAVFNRGMDWERRSFFLQLINANATQWEKCE
jgi:hypothetical protein